MSEKRWYCLRASEEAGCETCVCRLEIDNARLEASNKQQSNKIEALQKEVQESMVVSVPKRTAPLCLVSGHFFFFFFTLNKASEVSKLKCLKFVKLIKWLLNLKVCDIVFQPSDSSPGGGVGTEDGDPLLVSPPLITTNNCVEPLGTKSRAAFL